MKREREAIMLSSGSVVEVVTEIGRNERPGYLNSLLHSSEPRKSLANLPDSPKKKNPILSGTKRKVISY